LRKQSDTGADKPINQQKANNTRKP